jgi:arylsulfatase A-like enzyme
MHKQMTLVPIVLLVLVASSNVTLAVAARKPNVLLIVSDDQGYGDAGIHGNPQLRTPHLDRLATEGIRLDQFHVNPLCAPTRAALLTGRYSLRTGVWGVSEGAETMRLEEYTLGEMFRAAGYRTGYFGKWHNGEHYPYTPEGQGFGTFFGFALGHWNNYFDTSLRKGGHRVGTRGFITDVLTEEAARFVRQQSPDPFFCYVAYNVPHSPLQCPETEFRHYKDLGLGDQLAAIYGMCSNLDSNIGTLLEALRTRGILDNTIVLFLGDNGPATERFNAGMRGTKGTLFLGGVRVPAFLRWPVLRASGRVIDRAVAHIDILPTLAELVRTTIPDGIRLDGRSLVPLLQGGSEPWPDRRLFIQNTPWRPGGRTLGSVRTQRHHLVNDGRGWQLFDLETDPGETRDITQETAGLAKPLIGAYEEWWREVSEGVPSAKPPIPIGHAEENPVELTVPEGLLLGGTQYGGRHPNNGWAVRWTEPGAAVEWEASAARAGRYEASVAFLCAGAEPDARIRLRSGTASTEAVPVRTPRIQLPSPDRYPRTEVFEMKWQRLTLGTVELPRGTARIRVEVSGRIDNLELKHLELRFIR